MKQGIVFQLLRKIRYYLLRFKRLRGTPHSLALGAALGIGLGIAPITPLQSVIIIFCAVPLRANAVLALIMGSLVSNPLTIGLQYYLVWKVGNAIFPHRSTWQHLKELLQAFRSQNFLSNMDKLGELGLNTTLVMLTGGLVLGLPAALLTYFVSRRLFAFWQRKKQEKHLLTIENKS